jgi:DNA-binding CsgD family transcriptional regulator
MKVSLEQFSEAVAQIHEAAAAPQQWPQALAAIMSLVDGERASLLEIEATGSLSNVTQIGHDPASAREYAKNYYAIDPTCELVFRVPSMHAIATYDFFSEGYRSRHPYFDFARRIDIGDVAGLHCPSAHNRRSALGVQRAFRAKRYGADERKTLELLARHISIARRVEGQLGEAWAAAAQMEAAFAAISCAALVLDGSGAVQHANAAAESLLRRGEGVGVRHGRLRFTDPPTQARFLIAVRAAVAEFGRSSAHPLVLANGETAELLIAPLRPNNPRAGQWQLPLALAVISVGGVDTAAIAWRMRQVYGLTPAEARVASLLAVGKNLQEIATVTGVTEPTLRTHLRSIFGKTGTRRQAELVAVALRAATFGAR